MKFEQWDTLVLITVKWISYIHSGVNLIMNVEQWHTHKNGRIAGRRGRIRQTCYRIINKIKSVRQWQ